MLGVRAPSGTARAGTVGEVAGGVAIDVSPLIGARTGVGSAVGHLLDALEELPEPPDLHPYVLSFRARLPPGTVRLRYPAALAHRCWARSNVPDATRRLGRPGVVHGTNYVVPPARCARLVSVYDCWFLRHGDRVHPDVARAGAVLRRSVRRGAVVHASSEATAAEVTELLGPARVEVIPLGAIPAKPPPMSPPPLLGERLDGRPYVLALGTIEHRKNLHRLIDSFATLHPIHPSLVLVVAGGDGNGAEALAVSIARLTPGAAANVVRLGRVDEPTKSWLLHHATVLAYPSLDEGFGFPLLEAMSADLPVVASTAGSIPEVAGAAAVLVDPLDVDGLASALDRVVADDRLRSELTAAGRTRLAHYSWRTTAERMAGLYASLAMEGPPA